MPLQFLTGASDAGSINIKYMNYYSKSYLNFDRSNSNYH